MRRSERTPRFPSSSRGGKFSPRLNLYNLPTVTTNQSLQVWVKPLDGQDYRPVGEVPAQFYGKSGAVSYALPAGTATPAEVLITLEPRQPTVPVKPTGPVVLRGP